MPSISFTGASGHPPNLSLGAVPPSTKRNFDPLESSRLDTAARSASSDESIDELFVRESLSPRSLRLSGFLSNPDDDEIADVEFFTSDDPQTVAMSSLSVLDPPTDFFLDLTDDLPPALLPAFTEEDYERSTIQEQSEELSNYLESLQGIVEEPPQTSVTFDPRSLETIQEMIPPMKFTSTIRALFHNPVHLFLDLDAFFHFVPSLESSFTDEVLAASRLLAARFAADSMSYEEFLGAMANKADRFEIPTVLASIVKKDTSLSSPLNLLIHLHSSSEDQSRSNESPLHLSKVLLATLVKNLTTLGDFTIEGRETQLVIIYTAPGRSALFVLPSLSIESTIRINLADMTLVRRHSQSFY